MNGSDSQRIARPVLPAPTGVADAGESSAGRSTASAATGVAPEHPESPFLLRLATLLGLATAVGGTALLAWWGDYAAESAIAAAAVSAQAGTAIEQQVADTWRLLVPPGP
jgi:hypothetical protein